MPRTNTFDFKYLGVVLDTHTANFVGNLCWDYVKIHLLKSKISEIEKAVKIYDGQIIIFKSLNIFKNLCQTNHR